jgi:hypothetical protein
MVGQAAESEMTMYMESCSPPQAGDQQPALGLTATGIGSPALSPAPRAVPAAAGIRLRPR